MTQFSNYLENELYDHILRNAAYTSPTTVYGALFTSDPGEAGGGTELSGNGYAREALTFAAPTDGSGSATEVTFGPATASWGTVTHFAIFDALTVGNMLFYAPLSASKTVNTDDTLAVTPTVTLT